MVAVVLLLFLFIYTLQTCMKCIHLKYFVAFCHSGHFPCTQTSPLPTHFWYSVAFSTCKKNHRKTFTLNCFCSFSGRYECHFIRRWSSRIHNYCQWKQKLIPKYLPRFKVSEKLIENSVSCSCKCQECFGLFILSFVVHVQTKTHTHKDDAF